jgi:aminomethyltransferase
MAKQTALFETHKGLNARITGFHGWEMPLYYTAPLQEHNAVRESCGLFDVSHMGEILVQGKDAERLLQRVLVRDIAGMDAGQVRLAVMCNEKGGVLDDLTVYQFDPEEFWLVVNAGPYENDLAWVRRHSEGMDVVVTGLRDGTAKLDLQGPDAGKVLAKAGLGSRGETKYYNFVETEVGGVSALVSRSGYTGEDGFELYFGAEKAEEMWAALMEAGKGFGIEACGLAARDTLRLEAGMVLYGQDLDEGKTPLQCSYRKLVCWEKDFVGKKALERQREEGVREVLAGFELTERGIARHGDLLFCGEKQAGSVTSGSFSPSLKKGIGLGYIEQEFSPAGTEILAEIRGKRVKARVAELPFYRRG